jgi:hypothetical protein
MQICAGGVVSHFEPFHGGASANAKRGGYRHALAVKSFQDIRHGRGYAIYIELVISMRGFNPAGIQEGQGWMKDRAYDPFERFSTSKPDLNILDLKAYFHANR